MKIACNVIKDLMILYEEDACTEESRSLVEQHLEECGECRKYFKELMYTEELLVPETEPEETAEKADEDRIFKSCFRKIRLRWTALLTAVLMLFPLVGTAVLCVHEYWGEGIAFTNLDDIYRCISFLRCIEKRDFESAVEYVDFTLWDRRDVDGFEDMEEEAFVAYMKERYLEKLLEYDALGITIGNIRFDWAYRMNSADSWVVDISVDEIYPDGSKESVVISLNSNGMRCGSWRWQRGSMPRILYIMSILNLFIQDDPLGYRDMPFGFEVKEGEKAVIVLKKGAEDYRDIRNVGLVDMTFVAIEPVSEVLLAGKEIEISVPGRYSLIMYTYDGEEFNLAEDERVEINIFPMELDTNKQR